MSKALSGELSCIRTGLVVRCNVFFLSDLWLPLSETQVFFSCRGGIGGKNYCQIFLLSMYVTVCRQARQKRFLEFLLWYFIISDISLYGSDISFST